MFTEKIVWFAVVIEILTLVAMDYKHHTIEPNRTRILRFDLPVYMFHGSDDANCPVEGIIQLKKKAEELNKKNIQVFIFPEHGHSLEFLSWVGRKSLPVGLKTLFEEIEKF
ncbi:MAG: hypothetical protein NTX22_02975 [Ignavibacteriales bacterium]|nr:hypothetical protein [Ignavibacteriales bacterium]